MNKKTHTLKICNAKVLDPLEGTFQVRDVAVDGAVMAASSQGDADMTIDASGCILTPGLIDIHLHLFSAVPGGSVRADLACLPYGVTTAVDAGTAGAPAYPLFHETEVERSLTRVLACLNIASAGLLSASCPEDPRPQHVDREGIRSLFRTYGGELIGLKLRNSMGIVDAGDEGPLRAMVELGEELGVPVVAHMTDPAIPSERAAGILRPGDIFCHVYHGEGNTILDENGRVKHEILEAKERGVLFDACNGNANFSFQVAEAAIAQGFLPDLIGSDLTPMSFHRPHVYDLPRLLTKYMMLGLSVREVLERATIAPARFLGLEQTLATLAPGTPADIALFRVADQDVSFTDRYGAERHYHQVLLPQMTVKDGVILWSQTGF